MEISYQDGVLTIRGERRQEHQHEANGAHRSEFSYGSFERSVLLPEGVNEEHIQATDENGILEVVVPKGAELMAPKRSPCTSAGTRRPSPRTARRADPTRPVRAGPFRRAGSSP